MGKILGSWSGMRKYLEKEMLADSLQGRIQYVCTSYPNMDDFKIFEIRVDGKMQKQFSWETAAFRKYHGQKNVNVNEAWHEFHIQIGKQLDSKEDFADEEFCDALALYRSLPIGEAIACENLLVRMFAILDRRVGKRTLEKLSENVGEQPEWLQYFYLLRFNAEGIRTNT